MNTVVVIEEDEAAREAIGVLLKRENFKAILAAEADHGLEQVCLRRPSLLVISLPLTEMSGAELCRRVGTLGVRIPIVFLSACLDPLEEILLLELGADDYVSKPFRECELMARIGAVLRRSGPRMEKRIRFGDVEIDVERRYIRRSGKALKMTPNEYNLLLFFIKHADRVLTRDVILNEVWGYECYPATRTVDAHVVRLRSKLEPDPRAPRYLLTIHGVGYRFLLLPAEAMAPGESTISWRAPAGVCATQIS
jgi:DNA-binding response OmpR family regulator